MNARNAYSRRILLAVVGLSPQVVTETLYALAVQRRPQWIPTEIHLITTSKGEERTRLSLLSKVPGGFHRLLADYQLPAIRFDSDTIHVLKDARGAPLNDIRTPEDNRIAADHITELVRQFTRDENSQIHASIAGSRKTMGYYLGYAMSLFGRPQDALSHVLVSEPFESSWDFFYPTPYSRVIELRDKNLADTKEAEVSLAEIPFVRLRQGLDERLLSQGARFSEVVEAANAALAPPQLIIDERNRRIRAGGRTFRLPPASLALLQVFARRAKNGEPPLHAPKKEVPDPEWAERFLDEYRRLVSSPEERTNTEQALRKGMDGDYFSQLKSRLKREMREHLGPEGTATYEIRSQGRPARFFLGLPPEAIHFQRLDPAAESRPPTPRTPARDAMPSKEEESHP